MEIKKVTQEEAIKIIDTREPIGSFYQDEGDIYVGIDNLYGHANVEEFKTKEECFAWLKYEEYYGDLDEKEIYRKALKKWGYPIQTVMVFEEMAELQKELSKSLRGNPVTMNIAEEIADVEIMLGQMKELYEIEDLVAKNKLYKLKRLEEKLEDL